MSSYFINGIGIISPQKTYEPERFLEEVFSYEDNLLNCLTPDFKTFINPLQLRRLGRMLRIGLTASILCQREAGLTMPDGIITGTGYGFLEETEKFLREIIDRKEQQISPAFFMQGTYNALSGLVALSLKCTGYNNTYVSKGFAFEHALNDALMQIDDDPGMNFLVGGYDEGAKVQHTTGLREGHYKKNPISSLNLFTNKETGTIQGEGAAFFALSGTAGENTWCELIDVQTVYRPDELDLLLAVEKFLQTNNTTVGKVDAVINGMAGDPIRDKVIGSLGHGILGDVPQLRFKHLSGEYCTAICFGLWLGAKIIKTQNIPDAVKVQDSTYPKGISTILIVNQYLGRNYSLILLKNCPARGNS
ncbi:MAG: beta-ketoacyl synthase N-terminal-like domain-containing protein [Chryseolinea sp.]